MSVRASAMPNALTGAIAAASSLVALAFFGVLYHVASTQPAPSPPPPPSVQHVDRTATLLGSLGNATSVAGKCAELSRTQCLASADRCSWQLRCRSRLPSRSRSGLKGRGFKGLGAKQGGAKQGGAKADAAAHPAASAAASTSAPTTCVELTQEQCSGAMLGLQCTFDEAAHACVPKSKLKSKRRGGRTGGGTQKSVQQA